MAAANIFKITDGVFGLKLIDKAAVGYLDAWQAPAGKNVDDAVIADYAGTGGIAFQCQATSAALTASANTSDDVVPATMCSAEITTTIVGVTSYSLDVTVLQDPNVSAGISAYLFENDTFDAYFYLGYAGDHVPPAAIGRVTLAAGAIGGEARTTLTTDVSLPVLRKPDLWVGDGTTSRTILGNTALLIKATTMTAGLPGTFTPTTANWPSTITELTGATPAIVASPVSAWTTGQYVPLPGGSNTKVYWSGTAWTAGAKP